MQLRVALLPELLPTAWNNSPNTIAIVIDTLRFTTTACQALRSGAKSIRVASEIEEARNLAAAAGDRPLLCGERLCQPIAGFDLGNSPLEYTPGRVSARDLVFTTTNGTRAVAAAKEASQVWLASTVNRRAIASHLRDSATDLAWFVCAGTDGEVALEDVVVAGAIIDQLGLDPTDDAAQLAWTAWTALTTKAGDLSSLAKVLQAAFASARGGRNLIENGYTADVKFVTQLDSLDTVPKNTPSWNTFTCG